MIRANGDTEKFHFYALITCGVLVLIFLLQLLLGDSFTDAFLLTNAAWAQPWRFVTSILLHGGFTHLLYNCFALALFGSMLEKLIGGKGFFLVFFVTGIGANVIAVNFYPASLGASGAIFGVIGSLIVLRPLMAVFAFGMPLPMIVAGALWVIGDIIGTFIPSNVGTIAHLSGVGLGLILGAFYRRSLPRQTKSHGVYIEENSVRNWEDRWMR